MMLSLLLVERIRAADVRPGGDWMEIAEFLQEVDRLARTQSARLHHDVLPAASPPPGGHPRCRELDAFTTELLRAARPLAFAAPDSPTVQVLQAERNVASTRWRFTKQPVQGTATADRIEVPADADAPTDLAWGAQPLGSTARGHARTEEPEAA